MGATERSEGNFEGGEGLLKENFVKSNEKLQKFKETNDKLQ